MARKIEWPADGSQRGPLDDTLRPSGTAGRLCTPREVLPQVAPSGLRVRRPGEFTKTHVSLHRSAEEEQIMGMPGPQSVTTIEELENGCM
jgi:hypothetical protein